MAAACFTGAHGTDSFASNFQKELSAAVFQFLSQWPTVVKGLLGVVVNSGFFVAVLLLRKIISSILGAKRGAQKAYEKIL